MKVLVTANLKNDNKEKLNNTFSDVEFVYCKQSELTQDIADDCDVIVGTPTNVNLNRESLKALLLNSAGSDLYVKEGVLHKNTLLANASGSYGVAIAEHTIGMILALNKGFHTFYDNMKNGIWKNNSYDKELFNKWNEYKANKDFASADEVRKVLIERGLL